MDLLMDLFARGDWKQINPHANFDFLASVWANLSAVRPLVNPPPLSGCSHMFHTHVMHLS
jgi:hypothetical protein